MVNVLGWLDLAYPKLQICKQETREIHVMHLQLHENIILIVRFYISDHGHWCAKICIFASSKFLKHNFCFPHPSINKISKWSAVWQQLSVQNLWYNAENQFIATAYSQTVATDVAKLLNMKVVLNLAEYNTQVINPRVCTLSKSI